MSLNTKTIPLNRIKLDLNNPRIPKAESESEAIDYLINNEKVYEIAKDIIKQNALSPLDLIGVIENTDQTYTVVEGNRRIAALKILKNPNIIKNENLKKKFQTLSSKLSKNEFTSVTAIIFPDRESSQVWIERKHLSDTGTGTKPWNATQKARQKKKGPEYKAVLFLDAAVKRGLIPQNEVEKLNITTLARYLSNPTLRSTLSIELSDTAITTHLTEKKFNELLERIIKDLQNEIINSRAKAPNIIDYSAQIHNELNITDHKTDKSTQVYSNSSEESETPPPTSPTKQSTTTKPKKQKTTPYSVIKNLKTENLILQQVIKEFTFQYSKKRPISCLLCLRIIFEVQLHTYLQNHEKKFYHSKSGIQNEGIQALVNTVHSNFNQIQNNFTKEEKQGLKELKDKAINMNQTSHGNKIPNMEDIDLIITNTQALLEKLFSATSTP